MTRTYRMYIDQGISDRLMNFIWEVLPSYPQYAPRFKPTRIARGSSSSWFDYELIIVRDGTEFEDLKIVLSDDYYYERYTQAIQQEIQYAAVETVLLNDSGRPTKTSTHKYNIEPAIIVPKTHLYDIVELITQTMTHKYNVEI